MKRRPWPLIILALLHVFAPVGNLFMNSFRHNIPMAQLWNLWWAYLPKMVVSTYVFVPIVAGVLIYICKRWSFYAYLACLALIFAVSLYGFSTDVNLLNFIYLVAVLVVDFFLVAYFMVPAVRQVYMDPRLRWWESAHRYRADLEAEVAGQGIGQIVNISEGGLFYKTAVQLQDDAAVEIKFTYNNSNYLVSGIVVHHRMMGDHGYGIQFQHTHESLKLIKKLIRELDEDGRMLTDRLPGEEDSFMAWLRGVFTSGKGLVPKANKR